MKIVFISVLILAGILCILMTSCVSTPDPEKAGEKAEEITSSILDEIKPAKTDEGAPGGVKFMFYVLGALCFLGAGGVLLIFKDRARAVLVASIGLLLCCVPFFLDVLYSLLGPLKWMIYICLFALMAAALVIIFYKVRNIIHDLAHPDEADKENESSMIVVAAKKRGIINKMQSGKVKL